MKEFSHFVPVLLFVPMLSCILQYGESVYLNTPVEGIVTLCKFINFCWCFSRFLNCTNRTKSRKTSQPGDRFPILENTLEH